MWLDQSSTCVLDRRGLFAPHFTWSEEGLSDPNVALATWALANAAEMEPCAGCKHFRSLLGCNRLPKK